jgi:hypothetical protein
MSGSGTLRRRHKREVRKRHALHGPEQPQYTANTVANKWWGDMYHAMAVRNHIQKLNAQYIKQAKRLRSTDVSIP